MSSGGNTERVVNPRIDQDMQQDRVSCSHLASRTSRLDHDAADLPAAFVLTIHLAGMVFAAGLILTLMAMVSPALKHFFQNF